VWLVYLRTLLLSVRSDEEMEDDECGNERVEEDIWKMC
jgi:hypothetical protein